ncbi:GCN5 family acetyltransferase [Intrasporangium oryzae NRRL B-24470]|uniref:GCN5 family acetyltransferase n=1 Tax=Intrasporangium oryzae NRRL B-24470 TaxID=1386089 RepID=W9G9Y0_9MICO|nr:GNAT family N-acetyltransferase [Intrasporangium oryzae]EWT02890.1 GCN5 family acetyltransferase [Intrasporangium oryzae NRRL B-24470]
MGRAVVTVHPVEPGLHAQFIELWITHRIEGGTTPEAARRLALDGTLRTALQRNDIAAFIAFMDQRPVGYIVIADSTRSLLVVSPCVSVDMLYVVADVRRHGVGRALLAAAARYAERRGAEHIASTVPAQDREANRFFARIGFAAETVRRVTPVAALKRRLGGECPSQRRNLEALLQRRRDVRAAPSRLTRAEPPQIAG